MSKVRVIGRGALIAALGTVVAWSAFSLTSQPVPPYLRNFSTPPCTNLDMHEPGFNPWTGLPHGWTYECTDRDGRVTNHQGPAPAQLAGRMAMPIPLGFLLGAIIGVILLWLGDRLRPGRTITAGRGPRVTFTDAD